MTKSITPFKAFVEEKYLYDMDTTKVGLLQCDVVAVSAYMGQSLTFTIIIDGSMFANIPIFALRWKAVEIQSKIADSYLAFINCPDKNIDVFVIETCSYQKPVCYIKKYEEWYTSNGYILTVDFYNDNELVHLIMLENYQFGWFPNHKIKWDGKPSLPDFKKLHKDWNI